LTPHRLLAGLSLLWAGALPVAAAGASGGGLAGWVAVVMYGVGAFVCHQRPERSFHWGAAAWPVCARCTGIYVGLAAAAMLGQFVRRLALAPARARLWLAVASLPAAGSLGYEWATGVTPSNAVRAVTGVLLGSALGWMLTAFLADAPNVSRAQTSSSDEVN
jgi:uncharacterized membrane protein